MTDGIELHPELNTGTIVFELASVGTSFFFEFVRGGIEGKAKLPIIAAEVSTIGLLAAGGIKSENGRQLHQTLTPKAPESAVHTC